MAGSLANIYTSSHVQARLFVVGDSSPQTGGPDMLGTIQRAEYKFQKIIELQSVTLGLLTMCCANSRHLTSLHFTLDTEECCQETSQSQAVRTTKTFN